MTPLLVAALVSVAQPQPPVNVPYPLSPEEAAQRFLAAVDAAKPAGWLGGLPGGTGPYLTVAQLQAKTSASDGSTVLMVGLPSGTSALVKSPSGLPEIAVGQQLYLLVDFSSDEGPAVACLRGLVMACDVGTKADTLDAMIGVQPKRADPSMVLINLEAPQTTSPALEQPATSQTTSPSASPGSSVPGGEQLQPGASGGPTSWGAQPPALPEQAPTDAARVQFWKDFAGRHNPRLTDAQREAIVRWVLYYSAYYGVDHRLVFSVMKWESSFDPGCVSRAGAIGLMQLMPETAKDLGVNPWVVEENIRGGIAELAGYLDQYSGMSNYDQCALALACYNAGPNRVKRAGGIPNIPETVQYVKRVTTTFAELVASGAP
ncbi:MAG: lytic transglycosylase domain-containing protein [Armatimonadetes bacterium]|nr:lytic transglycosylase domain-containing protein [Armatimonadota bacterium]